VELRRYYPNTALRPSDLRRIEERFGGAEGGRLTASSLTVHTGDGDEWRLNNFAEWVVEYQRSFPAPFAMFHLRSNADTRTLQISLGGRGDPLETSVVVTAPTVEGVHDLFAVVEEYIERGRLPEPPAPPRPEPIKPRVFLGHGHSGLWRDLKDHLADQQGIDVHAYETGIRAGHLVRDVLDGLLRSSTMALLVLTAEDETAEGEMRARENVVHEVGLFQGRLGWDRAIALVEDGVTPFSNMQGINVIKFGAGNIRETYGDVVATIRREFPGSV
jgi:hypothetical protein